MIKIRIKSQKPLTLIHGQSSTSGSIMPPYEIQTNN